mgnify:FL=1
MGRFYYNTNRALTNRRTEYDESLFYTLGCKVNQNETGALAQLFEQNGFTVVEKKDGADVYVVNSCTVTNFGDQKSRKWLRRAKRENPAR